MATVAPHRAGRQGSRSPSSSTTIMITTTAGTRSDAARGSKSRLRSLARPRRRSISTCSVSALALGGLFGLAAAAATTPDYTPTTIFLPPSSDTAYIFAPPASSDTQSSSPAVLLSLNITSLNLSSAPTILSSSLPISPDEAFIPLLLPNGTLAVFSGSCSTPSSASLHTFSLETKEWSPAPYPISVSSSSDYAQTVPYRLSSGLAFSLQLEPVLSQPALYFYGGHCGDTFSNTMLRLEPSGQLSGVKSNNPPSAAAGFTLVELTPASVSNRGGTVTQSSGYLLLGGHTREAGFVNASAVGVWGLPGEEWEFMDVSGSGKQVGRSGHTSVVSEDGGKVIVYGGWAGGWGNKEKVGMGVLKVGVGRDGWEWEDVKVKDEGKEKGRYGHGAVRLPGDVMMVYGGWEVGAGKKRDAVKGGGLRFLDMERLEWVDGYKLPAGSGSGNGGGSNGGGGSGNGNGNGSGSGGGNGNGNGGNGSGNGSGGGDGTGSGSGSSNGGGKGGNGNGGGGGSGQEGMTDADADRSKKIGLGVGLGIGLFILALAGLGFCLVHRRKARRRAAREATLRNLTLGINGSLPHGIEGDMAERDDGLGLMFPWNAASAREWYTGGGDPYSQGQRSLGYESLRGGVRKTGATVYMPPPPSPSSAAAAIGGRPRNARGLYVPTNVNSYDFAPMGQASRNIDPIYEEADEDDGADLGSKGNYHPISPDKEEYDEDPFLTPTTSVGASVFPPPNIGVNPSSQGNSSPVTQQDPEVQNWKSEIDAADAVLSARIARHGSTTTAPPRLMIPPTRAKSVKKAAADPSSSSSNSDRTHSNLSEKSAFSFVQGTEQRFRPATSGSGEDSSSSAKTFSTAKSSFPMLQAEGRGLLLNDAPPGQKEEEDAEYVYVEPGSPSKSRPQSNRRSWLGSLRRVFSGGTPESGSSGSLARAGEEDGGGNGGDYQQLAGGTGTTLLQRRKQGKEAWTGDGQGGNDGDDDWDVERAVEQRLVQVMFTVPKERLRVVNAEIESLQEEQSVILVNPGDESEDGTVSRESSVRVGGEKSGGDVASGGGGSASERLRVPSDSSNRRRNRESVAGSVRSIALTADGGGTTIGGISPSASLRAASIAGTETLHTAEAVRLERPRTRVLAMVESIESKSSRDNSPSGSTRSSIRGGNTPTKKS